MYIAAPPIQASRLCGARTAPSVVCMPFMSLLSALIICEDADQQRHMRWHATACRWSCAESTNPRHDNEDLARADGVRIDCERATAAQDSRVREDNSLPQRNSLPRNLTAICESPLRAPIITYSQLTEKSASQCYAPVQSACFMNSKKSKRSPEKQKRSLYELKEIEKKQKEVKCSLYEVPTVGLRRKSAQHSGLRQRQE